MNGVLPLFKPKGMTSHDCVGKVRRLLNIKKIGHTGTLDPNVEGVLPLCIGAATKIIPFLTPLKKRYVADVCLGTATDTEDKEGNVIQASELSYFPSEDDIKAVLHQFLGEITQLTPLYSAVKVKGRKLYEYARENLPVERPKRQITIHNITYLHQDEKEATFTIDVTCSKGTYIRTLCVDIGKALGYPAHMGYLKRIETDGIELCDTFTFEDIEQSILMNDVETLLVPIEEMLTHLDSFVIHDDVRQKVLYGQKLPKPNERLQSPFRVIHNEQLLAIYEHHETNANEIKPVRVFNIDKM